MIVRRNALVGVTAATALVAGVAVAAAAALSAAPNYGTAALSGRAILPSSTFRAGSAESGVFFGATDRASAERNGLLLPATGAAFAAQPVQGISNVIPADVPGLWWALSDNGYGARGNSADYQLAVYKVQPAFSTAPASPAGTVEVVGGFTLSDPAGHVPWQIVCDPTTGALLPAFDFNVLPATTPALCSTGDRVLTGFDFDPESMQIGRDGTFWFGDEFGPFLLHTDATGALLEAPIAVPGVKAPQNPTLDLVAGERPTAAASRGFEGMGISPDRRYLYGLLEGSITGDNPSDLRILRYDIRKRAFSGYQTYRTEVPAAQVNTTTLRTVDGALAYPGDVAPVGTGPAAIGELTILDNREAVVIERDSGGDSPNAPRFKKVFPVTFDRSWNRGAAVDKTPALVDLLAVPDPDNLGADGPFFRFPFLTIESVHPIDDHTLLVVNDNNFPFSNGRSFSQGGALRPDDNEFITVAVSGDLDVDRRLLRSPAPRD